MKIHRRFGESFYLLNILDQM